MYSYICKHHCTTYVFTRVKSGKIVSQMRNGDGGFYRHTDTKAKHRAEYWKSKNQLIDKTPYATAIMGNGGQSSW